jgi:hypothetical protein
VILASPLGKTWPLPSTSPASPPRRSSAARGMLAPRRRAAGARRRRLCTNINFGQLARRAALPAAVSCCKRAAHAPRARRHRDVQERATRSAAPSTRTPAKHITRPRPRCRRTSSRGSATSARWSGLRNFPCGCPVRAEGLRECQTICHRCRRWNAAAEGEGGARALSSTIGEMQRSLALARAARARVNTRGRADRQRGHRSAQAADATPKAREPPRAIVTVLAPSSTDQRLRAADRAAACDGFCASCLLSSGVVDPSATRRAFLMALQLLCFSGGGTRRGRRAAQ